MCPVALGEVYTFPVTVVRMTLLGVNNEKMNAVRICESYPYNSLYSFDFA